MPSSYEATSLTLEFVKICKTITSLRKARQLHASILTAIPLIQESPYLNNNILSLYTKCASLIEARQVFDKMPHRNIVSFNALISAYSRDPNHAFSSFDLLTQLENEWHRPNEFTFTSLLQASSSLGDSLVGTELHAQVVRYGFVNNVCVQTSLLGMYSSVGELGSAREVFENIVYKDSIAWNSIILGYLKNDKIEHGVNFISNMVRFGEIPTQFTYSMAFNACGQLGDLVMGQIIHAQVIVSSLIIDNPLQNALIDMYCSCGNTGMGFNVFRRIENPTIVPWNTMIAGYSENGQGETAMDLFNELRKLSYTKQDEYTFSALISGIGDLEALKFGMPLHAQVIKTGFMNIVYIGSTLISMYLKNGNHKSAQTVFYSIEEKDVIIWTEMVTGFSKMSNAECALKFFQGMCCEGHKVDSFALSSALSACTDLTILTQGEMIHSQAIKTGLFAQMSVVGSLIDMYAKNGNFKAANSLFSQVINPDLKCWNSMISGYSHHGRANEALTLFEDLVKHGLKPDHVTYLSILSACNHCGLVDKGKIHWNSMIEHGFAPGLKHYSCMVCLLSRSGLLDEAEELITTSSHDQNKLELWRTLLSSCVIKRNMTIGIRAAEKVLILDPEDKATHVLVSNLYASAGQWDGVVEMRRSLRELKVEKNPGLSWIEFTNDIHVFSSDDQLHQKVEEAHAELFRLQGNMSKNGQKLIGEVSLHHS